jgi:hypothetical protein
MKSNNMKPKLLQTRQKQLHSISLHASSNIQAESNYLMKGNIVRVFL